MPADQPRTRTVGWRVARPNDTLSLALKNLAT